ncbi:MAG: hypothetical protein HY313_03085 [Acidobacteria bacterium]|nr:hypothetical protein [Acidobacteriota bacterium]
MWDGTRQSGVWRRQRGLVPWSILGWMGCLLVLGAQAQTPPESLPDITFTKEFPNSQPAYYAISIREDSTASYRTAPDDTNPLQVQISPELTQQIFSLARKLNLFRDAKLESKRKVASLGKKTLAYQDGSGRYETTFNHTEVSEAIDLTTLFERISQTQQHYLAIEYLLHFDRLGIVKELLRLEANLDQDRLLNAEQLLPLLKKIRDNRSLVQVAQGRAAQIIAKIQAGKP